MLLRRRILSLNNNMLSLHLHLPAIRQIVVSVPKKDLGTGIKVPATLEKERVIEEVSRAVNAWLYQE